jgi:hypothetical protein
MPAANRFSTSTKEAAPVRALGTGLGASLDTSFDESGVSVVVLNQQDAQRLKHTFVHGPGG